MTALRDASELLWPAVQQAIAGLGLLGSDAAAVKIAQRYAQIIDAIPGHAPRGQPDQAWAARWLMPLLLDALTELGATPAARARLAKGVTPASAPEGQLERLRKARAQTRR
ncbi:MAG TPA: hypothetical protein VIX86_06750 [Streptosporangiaceae bacterium]